MGVTRRIAAVAIASVGIFAGGAAIAPTAALAYPQYCSSTYSAGSYAYSYCASGSGSHRVVARCVVNGSAVNRYGPWVGTGSRSYYYCNAVGSSFQRQGD